MRVLLLFRGSAGCGKSTYIKEYGLKSFTLCADDIRLLYSSPTLQVDGTMGINQGNDKEVWNCLFRILEKRMQNGEFTVIDATNSKTAELNRYKELARDYRYRIYCIDMTGIPPEEVKRRNASREEIKRVPDEVIDKFYSRFETQQIPAGIKVLQPDELDTIWYKSMDLSEYKKIHVFGDIHGCYTALKEYMTLNGAIKPDEFYIFTGDYIDRGIENAEVVKYICELSTSKNVVFLEGNHERWLWLWANDVIAKSKEFEFVTKPQLEKANVDKKAVREFYRRLGQCCYFTYHGNTYIITHGGISNVPENLLQIATEQMIKGVGGYRDADDVDAAFYNNTDEHTYQIHGHRNVVHSPIATTQRTFNLEGEIEFGGHLRILTITENGISATRIENHVFKDITEEVESETNIENVDMTVYGLVDAMRKSRNIYEKQFGRISSFNFTREAFEKSAWDEVVNKARGLYIDVVDYKIVARAYDKFFNINERPETKFSNLQYKLQFPVTAYVKENGFLGIVGWNTETDELLFTSKSSPTGDFSDYFNKLLHTIYDDTAIEKMKQYIKSNNVSFVFECCDMGNDPHIIEYSESKVVLLDVIKNEIQYEKLPYDELVVLAKEMGLTGDAAKNFEATMDTWNKAVAAGEDKEFGRNNGMDEDLATAPYYAIKIAPGIHHTMGGLKIDTTTHVIDTKGNAIPGLFAAGEVAGGVHGGNRIGGNAVCDIVVFGRIAGKNASDFASK